MIIYPAMDLLQKKCVRLMQGDYDKVTVYSENPEELAAAFKDDGADWIHMVDLGAAKTGIPENKDIIAGIVKRSGLKVQVGGGIRNMDILSYWLEEAGVTRCVIGTAAIKDRAFVKKSLARYGDRIAIGLDARDGEVAVDGWTAGSGLHVMDFALSMMELGAKTFIYTDIKRDGMLTGPAVEGTRLLAEKTKAHIISSGGIGSIEDVKDIKSSGCDGVIIGKALYEGKVRLTECLQNE